MPRRRGGSGGGGGGGFFGRKKAAPPARPAPRRAAPPPAGQVSFSSSSFEIHPDVTHSKQLTPHALPLLMLHWNRWRRHDVWAWWHGGSGVALAPAVPSPTVPSVLMAQCLATVIACRAPEYRLRARNSAAATSVYGEHASV